MRRGGTLLLASVVAALAAPGSAAAAVVIGSNLAGAPNSNMPGCNNPGITCTAVNVNLPLSSLAAGGFISPVNGTVISWRAEANVVSGLKARVLRPQRTGTVELFTGVGTSAQVNGAGSDTGPVPTSLPIKVGDTIGLDGSNGRLIYAATTGGTVASWSLPGGPLADGSTRAPDTTTNNEELLVQATVDPSNTVTFGSPTLNKKKGTAILPMHVPNGGSLSYGGTAHVDGPTDAPDERDFDLVIFLLHKRLNKLEQKGKLPVTVAVTFTPTNGTPHTEFSTFKLRKKLKR